MTLQRQIHAFVPEALKLSIFEDQQPNRFNWCLRPWEYDCINSGAMQVPAKLTEWTLAVLGHCAEGFMLCLCQWVRVNTKAQPSLSQRKAQSPV